ncbi:MAG: cupin domain-containing protein [Anaerolineae bacterium]|nr:cupin domain-containing protein [Anaerolineae bacterium]
MFQQTDWVALGQGGKRKTIGDGEKMMILEIQFETGGGVPPHSHPHEQISYIVSGKMEYTVEGKAFILSAGQSAVVPGGITHSATALEPSTIVEAFSPPREEFRPK